MKIGMRPILPFEEEGTRFSAARALPDEKTEKIWKTFLLCWASVYTLVSLTASSSTKERAWVLYLFRLLRYVMLR